MPDILARILYVEDDVNLGFVTKDNLEMAHYEVLHCQNGAEAWEVFCQQPVDLCLIDVMLPQTDGLALARQIRQANEQVPILFLSALTDKQVRLQGFRTGADDYLTKPFSIEELILKMAVFLRRSGRTTTPSESGWVRLGAFRFHPANLMLEQNNQRQTLTQREAQVLHYLVSRPNVLVKRDDILHAIWGDDDYFMGRSLDVFISRLRKRLQADPTIRIENLHGVGFRLLLQG